MYRPKCGVKMRNEFVSGKLEDQSALPKRIGFWYDRRFKLPGLSVSGTRAVMTAAFVLANQYCPIPFYRTRAARSALIVLKLGPRSYFDGKGGTLAMADVRSLRDPAQREIWYDPDDVWRMHKAEDAAVYALPVTAHELCHTLGFGHGKLGLMAPYYDPLVTTPTEQEVARFFQEYPELE